MLDVKKLLAKILDVFKTTSTTLTGSYNLKAVAYRRCGIVTINIWQTALASIPKGAWITVGTLPEEYRPSHQLDTLGVDNNTSSVQNNSLQLRIPTSGEVKVWAYSNGVTTNQLLSTVTFIGGGYLTSKLYETFSHLERWWEYVRFKETAGENRRMDKWLYCADSGTSEHNAGIWSDYCGIGERGSVRVQTYCDNRNKQRWGRQRTSGCVRLLHLRHNGVSNIRERGFSITDIYVNDIRTLYEGVAISERGCIAC